MSPALRHWLVRGKGLQLWSWTAVAQGVEVDRTSFANVEINAEKCQLRSRFSLREAMGKLIVSAVAFAFRWFSD